MVIYVCMYLRVSLKHYPSCFVMVILSSLQIPLCLISSRASEFIHCSVSVGSSQRMVSCLSSLDSKCTLDRKIGGVWGDPAWTGPAGINLYESKLHSEGQIAQCLSLML